MNTVVSGASQGGRFTCDNRGATIEWGGLALPGFDRRLIPVEPERRQILAAHLKRVVAGISCPTGAPDMRPANPAAPDFSDACGACHGIAADTAAMLRVS